MVSPYKFNLLTVMHSGTRFVIEYFRVCGFYDRIGYLDKFPQPGEVIPHFYLNHFSKSWEGIDPYIMGGNVRGYPTLSTLQHPHRTAVSWFTRGRDINDLISAWDQFIQYMLTRHVIFFDINCPIELREVHLLSILKQLNLYEDRHIEITKKFVKAWEPVGAKHSSYRDNYLRDGTIPQYDWSRFDRAEVWYNRKIKEVHDNLTP